MLQAYALQKTIENLGYDCEQICLDNRITEKLSFKDKVKLVFKLKFGVFNLIKRKLYDRKINKKLFSIKQRQSEAFLEFQNLIPHTKKIYKAEEINELNDIFDEFVCGSDQVWTPYSGGIRPVPHKWNYYLEFTNKRKIFLVFLNISDHPSQLYLNKHFSLFALANNLMLLLHNIDLLLHIPLQQ
jgi:hypothetical protein